MNEHMVTLWREAMGVFCAAACVQAASYGYLMVRYRLWEMWPAVLMMALCAVYFWLRSRGWMESSQ